MYKTYGTSKTNSKNCAKLKKYKMSNKKISSILGWNPVSKTNENLSERTLVQ